MSLRIDESGKLCGDEYCRVEVIAKLFGVSVRRVQQLTQDGIIASVEVKEKGRKVRRYELAETLQRYIGHLNEKNRKKNDMPEDMRGLLERKLKAEIALKEMQTELHTIKRDIAEGRYIEVETVQMDYSRFFVVLKKFLLALPARISGRIQGYCDPIELRAIEKELSEDIKNTLNGFVCAGVEKENKN